MIQFALEFRQNGIRPADEYNGLLEVNAPLIEEQVEHPGLVDRAGAERVAERAFSAATALVVVSDNVAAYLDRHLATWGRLHVVPNGVNPNLFAPDLPPAYPGDSETFTIGFVGSLRPWHGLEILVEAFAALHDREPRVRLLVVGDGSLRAGLETDVAGAVDHGEVPAWLTSNSRSPKFSTG